LTFGQIVKGATLEVQVLAATAGAATNLFTVRSMISLSSISRSSGVWSAWNTDAIVQKTQAVHFFTLTLRERFHQTTQRGGFL
jgi:hypothetical protein